LRPEIQTEKADEVELEPELSSQETKEELPDDALSHVTSEEEEEFTCLVARSALILPFEYELRLL
jgi:hypothetical protein